MKIPHMSRRKFLKNISYSALASRLDLIGESIPFDGKKPLIVRVHDAGASRPWRYRLNNASYVVPFHLANAYTKADHIINLCLLKNHGSWRTNP